ncbi:MAG: PspC domain-containing protein [Ruminococcus sp.]|nr:PspC domain-containing protein [Ruminococcus sp.]
MEKKLTRKTNGQMLCGVCNGIADYFGADVTLVRLVFAASMIFGGSGLFLYIAGAVIMPEDKSV